MKFLTKEQIDKLPEKRLRNYHRKLMASLNSLLSRHSKIDSIDHRFFTIKELEDRINNKDKYFLDKESILENKKWCKERLGKLKNEKTL